MNRIVEKFYDISPDFMKDVMTSLYGFKLYKDRYRGRFTEYLREVGTFTKMSLESLKALQDDRLRSVVRHAYENVPYYGETFRSINLVPDDIKSESDLWKLPILEKEVVRNKANSLIAKNIPKNKVIVQHTSGTTGTPLNVYNTFDGLQYSHALEFFVRILYGLGLRSRRASFIGRIIVPSNKTAPPFWHYNFMLKQYLFSSYHMSDRNLIHYVKKLDEIKPEEIVGYPSSLYALARYLVKNRINIIKPKVVFGNSEPILEYQRDMMEEAFGCPVREWYSSTEQAFFGYECQYRNYHIVHPYGIVQVVDRSGNPVPDGEEGQVVCTGLTNYAMPLIRYQIGDRAILGSVDCPCGDPSRVFKYILGRNDDMIVAPDGRGIGRLDPVFKGLVGVRECQIIQKKLDQLLLKIVKDESYSAKDEQALMSSLRKRLGEPFRIDLEYVDEIPREKNGKFRAVISEISGHQV